MHKFMLLITLILLVGCASQPDATETATLTPTAALPPSPTQSGEVYAMVMRTTVDCQPIGDCVLEVIVRDSPSAGVEYSIYSPTHRLIEPYFAYGNALRYMSNDKFGEMVAATDFQSAAFNASCPMPFRDRPVRYDFYTLPNTEPTYSLASCAEPTTPSVPLVAWMDEMMGMIHVPDFSPRVVIEHRGGVCPQSECQSKMMVTQSGHVIAHIPEWGVEMLHQVGDELNELMIQTDLEVLKATPFSGTCPTADGGQEIIYTFYRDDGSTERIASCEAAIDPTYPIIGWLDELMAELSLPAQSPEPSAAGEVTFQVEINYYGGACPYGECESRLRVFTNPGNPFIEDEINVLAPLPGDEYEALGALIAESSTMAAGFPPMMEPCPIVHGGQKIVYTIQRMDREFYIDLSSCERVIDHSHPLIAALDALVARISDK